MGRWRTVRGITGAPASRHTKTPPRPKYIGTQINEKKKEKKHPFPNSPANCVRISPPRTPLSSTF